MKAAEVVHIEQSWPRLYRNTSPQSNHFLMRGVALNRTINVSAEQATNSRNVAFEL